MLSAFTSHLGKELFYSITLVVRKGKNNLTLIYSEAGCGTNQEGLIKEFYFFGEAAVNKENSGKAEAKHTDKSKELSRKANLPLTLSSTAEG
jgi:hypothetical protein